MDFFASIDIYCERTDASYWSEPINALTNLSFLLAAMWGWWVHRKLHTENNSMKTDWLIAVAIIMAALIGVGSYFFHTFANVWSSLADVIPIWSFVAFYLFLAIYRIVGTSLLRAFRIYGIAITITLCILWLVSTQLLATDSQAAEGDGLNGSTQYLPGMIALYGFAIVLFIRRHAARFWVFAAAVTFSLSIFFRTIDMMVCDSLPLGTHFLWHSLNGLFIAFLLQALVRYGQRPQTT